MAAAPACGLESGEGTGSCSAKGVRIIVAIASSLYETVRLTRWREGHRILRSAQAQAGLVSVVGFLLWTRMIAVAGSSSAHLKLG
jgi:hypothetical protein